MTIIADLVAANRILYAKGIVDGFGHVSARHPDDSERFLIARSMAPALVTADDLMVLDLDGVPCGGDPRPPYLERFIHGAIYRARPDVAAVVHSHSPGVIPFGITPGALRPVCHMCGFLGGGVPVFEIRDTAGEASDMLIRNRALGEALAASLGSAATVLMRGHGSTTVGASVRQAVFRAVYTELNARLQADAMRLGPVTHLTDAEAANASAVNDGQIDRAWILWARETAASIQDANKTDNEMKFAGSANSI